MTTGPNADEANALTVHIDPSLEDIVPGFLANRRRDVQKLETALQQNNLAQIRSIGHRIKGEGGVYGFIAISMLGVDLEQADAREDWAAMRRPAAELSEVRHRVTVVWRTGSV